MAVIEGAWLTKGDKRCGFLLQLCALSFVRPEPDVSRAVENLLHGRCSRNIGFNRRVHVPGEHLVVEHVAQRAGQRKGKWSLVGFCNGVRNKVCTQTRRVLDKQGPFVVYGCYSVHETGARIVQRNCTCGISQLCNTLLQHSSRGRKSLFDDGEKSCDRIDFICGNSVLYLRRVVAYICSRVNVSSGLGKVCRVGIDYCAGFVPVRGGVCFECNFTISDLFPMVLALEKHGVHVGRLVR